MDQIQYASERDLAIRNVDRETTLLREVKATLRRIRDGSFGTCMDCESPIRPKRLYRGRHAASGARVPPISKIGRFS
jgi:DnaK suppressor protein